MWQYVTLLKRLTCWMKRHQTTKFLELGSNVQIAITLLMWLKNTSTSKIVHLFSDTSLKHSYFGEFLLNLYLLLMKLRNTRLINFMPTFITFRPPPVSLLNMEDNLGFSLPFMDISTFRWVADPCCPVCAPLWRPPGTRWSLCCRPCWSRYSGRGHRWHCCRCRRPGGRWRDATCVETPRWRSNLNGANTVYLPATEL